MALRGLRQGRARGGRARAFLRIGSWGGMGGRTGRERASLCFAALASSSSSRFVRRAVGPAPPHDTTPPPPNTPFLGFPPEHWLEEALEDLGLARSARNAGPACACRAQDGVGWRGGVLHPENGTPTLGSRNPYLSRLMLLARGWKWMFVAIPSSSKEEEEEEEKGEGRKRRGSRRGGGLWRPFFSGGPGLAQQRP